MQNQIQETASASQSGPEKGFPADNGGLGRRYTLGQYWRLHSILLSYRHALARPYRTSHSARVGQYLYSVAVAQRVVLVVPRAREGQCVGQCRTSCRQYTARSHSVHISTGHRVGIA
eukprot:1283297-Rhodomonas_salina.3